MIDNILFEIAMSNSGKLGTCLGSIKFILQHGELINFDWKTLAKTYVNVVGEDPYSQDSITWIRAEAIRRGVDIG